MFNEKIICTYLYLISKYGYPPKAEDTALYIEEMTKLGFKTIELEGIREKHLLEVFAIRKEILSEIKHRNLSLPYFCVVLPGLSSLNESIRKKNLSLFKIGCELAAYFGAQGVLDNAPLPPYEFPDDIPVARHYDDETITAAIIPTDIDWNIYWKSLADTYGECCDTASSFGLNFHIHPAVGLLASSTDAFINFYQAVGKNNLKFVIDTANQFFMKDNIVLSLIRLKDHVEYIHLSDNNGNKIEHLESGKGKINWTEFFKTLKHINYNGYIGIDIGGEESIIDNLDQAYLSTASFIEEKFFRSSQ